MSAATPVDLGPSPAATESFGSEARRILRLALPNVGTNIGRMLMGFIDFWMVSWLGTDAQAGVSPASFLVFSIMAAGNGIAISSTTFVAQSLGRGQPREAGAYAWQTIYLAGVFTIALLPVHWLAPRLFAALGHAPAVMAAETAFARVALWSIGPSMMVWGLDGFFNGVQRPGVSTLSVLVSLVSNTLLNWLLIFGHAGLPRMGVAGSALATVIGWCLRAALLAAVFLSPAFAERYATRAAWRPSWSRIARMFRIGLPTSVQWMLDLSAWGLFMSGIMGRFGTGAMAASNIAVQYTFVAFMPAAGVGWALTSLVGHAIGQGRPELAALRTRAALAMCTGYTALVGAVFVVGRGPLVRAFNADAAVLALGGAALSWAAIFQAFDGMGIIFGAALRGAGDTRAPAVAVIAYAWGVFVLGGWLVARFAPGLGLHGPWMMCAIYVILFGLTLWVRFARGGWRRIRLFDAAAAHDGAATIAAPALPVPAVGGE
ncbi:MAG: MATE family efflux transporter [Phycisphaerae bacterium]